MTKIPFKPIKWSEYPWNLENDQNSLETKKRPKCPQHKKLPKYPPKPQKNDQNTLET